MLVLGSLIVVGPAPLAAASHCLLGLDPLEPVLKPLGQCRNREPDAPEWTRYPSSTQTGRVEDYCVRVSDPDGDQIRQVVFAFWDAANPDSTFYVDGPFESGSTVCQPYAYVDRGAYWASAGNYDMAGAWGGWSDSPGFYVH